MHILLLGRDTFITSTIEEMVSYVAAWTLNRNSTCLNLNIQPSYDVIILNLLDFTLPPPELIRTVQKQLSAVPLLTLHTYKNEPLINPLFEAGATGYLQLGTSEEQVLKAIEKVAAQERHIALL